MVDTIEVWYRYTTDTLEASHISYTTDALDVSLSRRLYMPHRPPPRGAAPLSSPCAHQPLPAPAPPPPPSLHPFPPPPSSTPVLPRVTPVLPLAREGQRRGGVGESWESKEMEMLLQEGGG